MHLGEPIFIFILAFILLGPKKTSDLARQVGKLMAEFRKASNDFKYQFNEEMRVSEQQDQQRKQEAERAALSAGTSASLPANDRVEPENTILPPAAGAGETKLENTIAAVPYAISAVSATTGEEQPLDNHPLLRVDAIPPFAESQTAGNRADGTPANAVATVPAAATPKVVVYEEDGAPLHHG